MPMNPALAEERLDSKTCYATIRRQGRLVGYELSELLLSVDGGLVTLTPAGPFALGDGKRRIYTGAGISAMLVPRRTKTRPGATADMYTIDQHATFMCILPGSVRARKFAVDIVLDCSP